MKQRYLQTMVCSVSLMMGLGSCGHDSPDAPQQSTKCTVLLYAVASNNLYRNLLNDKEEILYAARNMDLEELSMLVYQVTPNGNPALLELKRVNADSCTFSVVKEYSRNLYSTDPRRISEVISDAKSLGESEKYGLILWSHGTGLDPTDSSTHPTKARHPILRSFGSDKDTDKDPYYSDAINIDELADAIPDGMFNYIWFDACYMGGIETIYELRDKCEYFVGYPTEVFTPGMPYHLTIPYILSEKPDLTSGAEVFFNYYAENPYPEMRVATVAVVDMSKIEPLADVCKEAYAGAETVSAYNLRKYTRDSIGPFYDFGQYTKAMLGKGNLSGIENFEKRLNEMVIYKNTTDKDFNYNSVSPEQFSGISCHLYNKDDYSSKTEFYRTLDWFQRVYK